MATRRRHTTGSGKAVPATAAAIPVVPAEREPHTAFPIVGIGASAGGLAAFEAFFSGMPADSDPGMAFVLVQHLAPDHKSILTELVRRYTRMEVFEVEDGMTVRPNCAYIIPPNHDMAFLNGTLQLLEPAAPRGRRLPIDFFFRSLAQDQHERAIGIVLAGTGSDGTQGVRDIKAGGGMVIAQTPASTEYNGMPNSAIATGLVDCQLAPAAMPARLIAYAAHALDRPVHAAIIPDGEAELLLTKVFILLRARTGHDFSHYKLTTINRRIERRMGVHQIDTLAGYVKYLQQTPAEVDALFRDLLIGVTGFFRDPAVFTTLEEQVIPRLFAGRSADAVIRIWSPGCSSGEEAYSLAILLAERQEAMKQSFKVQVFATDIDSRAITSARAGLYPASIAADLTPERLARFFTAEPDGGAYRIHKAIRDLLVFSEQDVARDPPFSRLDLISCRNLMIYMGGTLQKKLIPLFYYALRPGGFLLLGTSETVGEFNDLFLTLDRTAKLYQRKDAFHGVPRLAQGSFIPPMTAIETSLPQTTGTRTFPMKLPLRELTEQVLLQAAPASALVNGQGDILYLHGRTGMYLEPAPGEVGISNVLKMAREGLRPGLTVALHKAAAGQETVRQAGLRVRTNGHFTTVNLTVRPVVTAAAASADAPPLYLVTLEEVPPEAALAITAQAGEPSDTDARIAAIQEELSAKEECLQASNEELESSNEELKSANEEMQSVNEELQSTNEELETSKEELQSVNEELATVNGEMIGKMADLARTNNDMNNLLAGTGIGTVFVDCRLRILRFTPTTSEIINLIPSDVGRPVAHTVSNLVGYDRLVADAQEVLDTLNTRAVDVQTTAGRWYTMRMLPYRTLENVIEGVVITFIDITDMKKAQQLLADSEQRYRSIMASVDDHIMVLNGQDRITYLNHGSPGIMTGDLLGSNWMEWLDPADRPVAQDAIARTLATRESTTVECRAVATDHQTTWFQVRFSCMPASANNQVVMIARDISARKQAEAALKQANDLLRLAVVVRDAHDAITVQDLEGRIVAWNPAAVRMYGWSEAEALGMDASACIPEALRDEALARVRQLSEAAILDPYHTQRLAKDGTVVAVSMTSTALVDGNGRFYAIATTERGREPPAAGVDAGVR